MQSSMTTKTPDHAIEPTQAFFHFLNNAELEHRSTA
jgi:hypothetical protein